MIYYLYLIICITIFFLILSCTFILVNSKITGSNVFFFTLIGAFLWLLFYSFEISATNSAQAFFWFKLKYFGIILIYPSFLLFVLSFTNKLKMLKHWVIFLLFIEPVITLSILFFDGNSSILFPSYIFNFEIIPHFGVWYWIHLTYTYIVLIGGTTIFCFYNKSKFNYYKNLTLYMKIAVLFPVLANFVSIIINYYPELKKIIPYNLTPPALLLSAFYILLIFVKYNYLNFKPIARDIVFDKISDGIIVLDKDSNIIDANEAAENLLDRKLDSIIGTKAIEHFYLWADFVDAFNTKKQFNTEVKIFRNNEIKYYDMNIYPFYTSINEPRGSVLVGRDVTDRKQIEEKFKYLSFHDQLTGLYNRTYFDEEIKRLSSGRRYPISVIMFDVDGLKSLNDTKGHEYGDTLIRKMSNFLLKEFRTDDMIARIGGDEFVVFLPCTDEKAVEIIRERLFKNLEILNKEQSEVKLNFSFGIKTVNKGDNLIEAIKTADNRMYTMKNEKKNTLQ
ncbi:MAG: hypothetical protein A2015_04775 [Spirochaetes bacterium GWF1_31_7]|nr:MAG: hypothetical protein A2Y30_05155 [Spirochaetes bacterium GWE1_32_154]OHD48782.1 MAG: hypothetical protein A2Y29_03130 [Spirochaetes bacterium GWE2_31_10]OHD52845.1 MAG: hypothetical protein A2015_04775 [Spirochaetes bacterium GWF1_31_7]OHD74148.1 MAG: hypothetical protein A2355_14015 [Spirochaetes bacterium RIFOXYB1_FULL_32_8]HBD95176.1 hypothetical protein [Spirochaetia bacterium]